MQKNDDKLSVTLYTKYCFKKFFVSVPCNAHKISKRMLLADFRKPIFTSCRTRSRTGLYQRSAQRMNDEDGRDRSIIIISIIISNSSSSSSSSSVLSDSRMMPGRHRPDRRRLIDTRLTRQCSIYVDDLRTSYGTKHVTYRAHLTNG